MSSPKRHVLILLLFILKCFSKSLVIRNNTVWVIFISESEVQPNREILAPPGVDTEQDKEQVLSIGKHPSLMKVIL